MTTREGLAALTEREKETLRLLVQGHDAKSIARDLQLSIHTVNERLRDARRKLGVTSSREAARYLVNAESEAPEKLGDKPLVIDTGRFGRGPYDKPEHRFGAGHGLLWLSGGMLVMSLTVALLALLLVFSREGPPAGSGPRGSSEAATPSQTPDPNGAQAARRWLALIDERKWESSWRSASTAFSSRISENAWASMARRVSEPLGPALTREVLSTRRSSSLPGAPAGEYEVVQFRTDFAHKAAAVETVALVRESGAWRVAGYFIR